VQWCFVLPLGNRYLKLQQSVFYLNHVCPSRVQQSTLTSQSLANVNYQRTMRACESYSGGQKRRLDIALGMIHLPQLLLLDEPTTGLDPQSRAYLWGEIKKLTAEGVTIFLTTQYMDEADRLCDRIAIIDYGEIIVTGTPGELKGYVGGDTIVFGFLSEETAHRAEALLTKSVQVERTHTNKSSVYLTIKDGERVMPELLRSLDARNLTAQSVKLSRPSIDDVFLKYTGRSLREDEGIK
jgi:ABC-2 type transport system ATP-binding protein